MPATKKKAPRILVSKWHVVDSDGIRTYLMDVVAWFNRYSWDNIEAEVGRKNPADVSRTLINLTTFCDAIRRATLCDPEEVITAVCKVVTVFTYIDIESRLEAPIIPRGSHEDHH